MAIGYIYILSNETHPELLKVGCTRNAVRDRAAELSSTSVPQPFEVEFFRLTAHVEEVERLIHVELQAASPNTNREFFRLPLVQVMQAVEQHVRRPVERFIREVPPPTCYTRNLPTPRASLISRMPTLAHRGHKLR